MDCPRLPTLVTGTINISTLPTGNHGQRAGDLCLSVSFLLASALYNIWCIECHGQNPPPLTLTIQQNGAVADT